MITFLEKDSKAQKIRKKRKSDSANPNAKKSAPEKEQEPDLEPEGPTIREQLEEKGVLMKKLMNEFRRRTNEWQFPVPSEPRTVRMAVVGN